MELWEVILLGLVQGLTEFLPVSSSGHLVLLSHLLGINEPTISFEVFVHIGSLLAIFFAFWQDITQLIEALFNLLKKPQAALLFWHIDKGTRILFAIIVGTLPAVLLTVVLKEQIVSLFNEPYFAGYMLIVTGTILYMTDKSASGKTNINQIGIIDGLIIGLGQAIAILPGVSRSGTTIGMGLIRGLDRKSAAKFSFLLMIPAIIGALLLSLGDLFYSDLPSATSNWILFIGSLTSFITSYLAIRFLLQFVKKGRFIIFAYYTWSLGFLIVLLSLGFFAY